MARLVSSGMAHIEPLPCFPFPPCPWRLVPKTHNPVRRLSRAMSAAIMLESSSPRKSDSPSPGTVGWLSRRRMASLLCLLCFSCTCGMDGSSRHGMYE